MKIKDPKTGKVFENARDALCYRDCNIVNCSMCPVSISNNGKKIACLEFATIYPAETAQLMGFEIIEEDKMEKSKSLKDWTLEEAKALCRQRAGDCDGCLFKLNRPNKHDKWCAIYAPPQEFQLTNKPYLTPAELAICKAVGAKWVSMDSEDVADSDYVDLWETKPEKDSAGYYGFGRKRIAMMSADIFPSIEYGELICVEGMTDGA